MKGLDRFAHWLPEWMRRKRAPAIVHFASSDGHPLCYRKPTRPRRGSSMTPVGGLVTCRRCLAALAAPVEPEETRR